MKKGVSESRNLTTTNPTHMKKSYDLNTARTCVLLYEDKPPPDPSSTGLPNHNWLGQAWSLYLVLSEKLSFFWETYSHCQI